MLQSKSITNVPLYQLFMQPESDVDVLLSRSARKYLNKLHKPSDLLREAKEFHRKHGVPEAVNEWGKAFDVDLGADGDYAMATILSIALKWQDKFEATDVTIAGTKYKAGETGKARLTDVPGLYEIPVENEDISFYVSLNKQNLKALDGMITHQRCMELVMPTCVFEEDIDLSDEFDGTKVSVDGEMYDVDTVTSKVRFEADLEGAEVKQAATASMLVSGCLIPAIVKHRVVLDESFYIYVKIKGHLAYAALLDVDSFEKV